MTQHPSFAHSRGLPYSLAAPDAADISRHNGAIGHEWSAPSPMTPMDSNGRYVEAPKEFTFKAPFLLHIDSASRDTAAYTNEASFRLRLPRPLRQVHSVEVLNVSYPNAAADPPGRYVLLLNGLWDGARFVPQGAHNLGIYQAALSTNTAVGGAAGDNTVSRYALAKMFYDTSAASDQTFRKSELRQIKYFCPVESQMQTIELTLADHTGTPLTFDGGVADHSWSVTLEIVCKN